MIISQPCGHYWCHKNEENFVRKNNTDRFNRSSQFGQMKCYVEKRPHLCVDQAKDDVSKRFWSHFSNSFLLAWWAISIKMTMVRREKTAMTACNAWANWTRKMRKSQGSPVLIKLVGHLWVRRRRGVPIAPSWLRIAPKTLRFYLWCRCTSRS